MADTRIDITAVDHGAKALIRGVADALRALSSVQAKAALDTQHQAQVGRDAASSFALQSRLAKAALADEKARLAATLDFSRRRIAALNKEREAEIASARKLAAAQVEVAKGFEKQAQSRLAQAQRGGVLVGGGISTVTPDLVAARRRELSEATVNVARAKALGQQQINQAKQLGAAQIQASQQTVQAQRNVVASHLAAARAAQANARAALTAANAQARAAQRASFFLQRQLELSQKTHQVMTTLRNTVLQLVAAYSGFRAIEGFIGAGLKFNQIIESSKLGIGALITAEAQLFDSQGNLLTGTRALAAAQGLAKGQLDKLRIAGIQTAATTEELVTAFQEAVGAGVSVGLTLDQIRQFTVQVAQAATTINLPFNQLNQEVRSILQGTIDRNSRIAKALQLTNAQINQAKEQGRLAELLNEKFKAFNIAGVESVKTFAALKSNIQDAFSVFAGAATEPLFVQLRDAGQKALADIFDFKTAAIQASFRGLVEGLQIIFRELGQILADSLGAAVTGAESLSRWFKENRQEVKQTAAAISTMVRDFGAMVVSIGEVITGAGRWGAHMNTITVVARLLSALFQTIRDNIGTIILLLSARALVTTLGNIATLVIALRTGAAVGSVTGPIGGIIATIIALGTAYVFLRKSQGTTVEETARMTTELEDQKVTVSDLVAQYVELDRAMHQKGVTDDEAAVLQRQMNQLMIDFTAAGGPGEAYVRILQDQTIAAKDKIKALQGLLRAETDAAVSAEFAARDRVFQLKQQISVTSDPKQVAKLTAELKLAEIEANRLAVQSDKITESLRRATEIPATIKRQHTPDSTEGLAPAIKAAKGELDRTKAQLDVDRARVNALFAARVIDAETRLSRLADIDLAELDAEAKLLQARRVEAERQAAVAPAGKKGAKARGVAADLLKQVELEEQALGFKRITITEDFNAELLNLQQERLTKEDEIRVRALKAEGRELEALLLEIESKTKIALQTAEHDFKAFSPEIQAQVRLAIKHESLQETVKILKAELQRILDTRTGEVQAIEARFKLSGKLSPDEKQDRANQIAAASRRATQAAEFLRQKLLEVRTAAKGDGTITAELDILLQALDTLSIKAQDVDLEAQKLEDGLRHALESGISQFFSSIGDESKTAANLFKDMVSSMISDVRRLIAELIAQKITSAILKFLGVAAGGASRGGRSGNLAQSEGRAEGGPAFRPSHGVLHGGIPGVDSIPILAQADEYFVKPKATRYYGQEFMDLINNMQLPRVSARRAMRFETGGITPSRSANSLIREGRQEVHHTFGFDEDGLVKVLDGRVGERTTLNHLRRNPNAVHGVLRSRR